MSEIKKNPGNDLKDQSGIKHHDDELNIGNNLSVGSENGSEVSDLEPHYDKPENRLKEDQQGKGLSQQDDKNSDDNGVNPTPDEVNPQKKDLQIENADKDKLNPYPDELKPDNDEEKVNSTWMISGLNRKV